MDNGCVSVLGMHMFTKPTWEIRVSVQKRCKTNRSSVRFLDVQLMGRVLGYWKGGKEDCRSRCSVS